MKTIRSFMKQLIVTDGKAQAQEHLESCITVADYFEEERETLPASNNGTLRDPPTSVRKGDTTLVIQIHKWGFKDATGFVEPRVAVSVRNDKGDPVEAVQETPTTSQVSQQYLVFENTVYLQTPINRLPEGSAIFFEFKHWKAKKQKKSCKAYCFMELDEIKQGPITLEVYKKPVNYSRNKKPVAAIFDPPPFQPEKLTVSWQKGTTRHHSSAGLPRKYTLTHNDITGALQLTVGSDFNYAQISGFYTRLLRDEVVAEWAFDPRPVLHIYCHVSGEDRWLAPPFLRNYIFRREIPLVLEAFMWADKELLLQHPELANADVLVHFQSSSQELDSVEVWGVLSQRSTWQPVPTSILKRMLSAVMGDQLWGMGRGAISQPLLTQSSG
ncbi:staygreen domain-containing protein [Haematococcus lacustris]|uniref:Staygreen domain-containing protein n=1 Tax=Haematococcus lacustris TaxID=44745 RepID=A0A699ZFZ7_HAELA|nr:staygreen domain-containing protein [Haematococcus lacustris]